MCVIVDKSVVGLVFGDPKSRPEAAAKLLEYINSGKLKLVVGGRVAGELYESSKFKSWLAEAVKSGTANIVPRAKVDDVEQWLIQEGKYKSNDPHVLALALVAGARLLYTHDGALTDDFKNSHLIPGEPGKVLQTKISERFTSTRRKLFDNACCRT